MFYCGDGGCSSASVLLEAQEGTVSVERLRSILDEYNIDGVHNLEDFRGLDPSQEEARALEELHDDCGFWIATAAFDVRNLDRLSGELDQDQFCIDVQYGHEGGVVLRLREVDDITYAGRTGGGAGAAAVSMAVPRQVYLDAVSSSMLSLREPIKMSLERELSLTCDPSSIASCSVIAVDGGITADATFPYDGRLGKPGHWHRLLLQIVPNQVGSQRYRIQFQMPVTQIRRWPGDERPALSGFETVDFDPDFEQIRYAIMDSVAGQTNACVTDEFDPGFCAHVDGQ